MLLSVVIQVNFAVSCLHRLFDIIMILQCFVILIIISLIIAELSSLYKLLLTLQKNNVTIQNT